jgi:hypothetical protein
MTPTPTSDEAALLSELRRAPYSTADALIRSLGFGSQATFSRLVTRAGDRVVAIGRARARRYAAARELPGLGRALPLYRVDRAGTMDRIGTLRPFAPRGVFVDDPARVPRWMRGAHGNGAFDALPAFVHDARPRGFLGRAFAGRHAAALGLSSRPDAWSDDDVLVALAREGSDVAGDLVVGDDAARRFYDGLAGTGAAIAADERSRAFAALAAEAIAGIVPGSFAGGEQPKFGVVVGDARSPRHVLVKFSPAEYSAPARRWCDLLVCEHLAAELLGRRGIAAVESEIVEGGSRVFLQTTRFDRVGARGRRAVVSLAAMNGEYVGMPPSTGEWSGAVERLEAARWVGRGTTSRVRLIETFGRFLANTDMHVENLAFLPRDDGLLDLAPVYDMLPMGYAPVAGEVPRRDYVVPMPEPGHARVWFEAAEMASGYWGSVAHDERVSQPFRAIAANNAVAIGDAVARMRPGESDAARGASGV